MNNLTKQGIRQSFIENMKLYPEDYPISNNDVSDDAISTIKFWVEQTFDNDNSDDKGDMLEWYDIVIEAYLDSFDDLENRTESEAFIRESLSL